MYCKTPPAPQNLGVPGNHARPTLEVPPLGGRYRLRVDAQKIFTKKKHGSYAMVPFWGLNYLCAVVQPQNVVEIQRGNQVISSLNLAILRSWYLFGMVSQNVTRNQRL